MSSVVAACMHVDISRKKGQRIAVDEDTWRASIQADNSSRSLMMNVFRTAYRVFASKMEFI